jgi:hypothetical protein
VIAIAYGGFYLIRMRQLRNANRDGVRRLLGLHRDASYGEVLQQVERIEPRPVTATGQLVLVAAAVATLALGVIIDQFTAALAGVGAGRRGGHGARGLPALADRQGAAHRQVSSAHAGDGVPIAADERHDLLGMALVAGLQDQLDAGLGDRHLDALAVMADD